MGNHQHLEPVLFLFSKLVNVLGTVRAVVNTSLHLGAELDDGSEVIGQHLLTGKETDPLTSPIRSLFLSSQPDKRVPAEAVLRKKTQKLIAQADLICYPPGSFYTSLMANLLPRGVASAIAGNDCPKVYIPNRGDDPEQIGMNARAAVDALLNCLHTDKGRNTSSDKFLNFVLMDNRDKSPMADLPQKFLQERGIQAIRTRLVTEESAPYYDPDLLVSALLSLT
jgi:CofD-related protein of GAK system